MSDKRVERLEKDLYRAIEICDEPSIHSGNAFGHAIRNAVKDGLKEEEYFHLVSEILEERRGRQDILFHKARKEAMNMDLDY